MSGIVQRTPRTSKRQINEQSGSQVTVPVLRSRDYVRLMPNQVSAWAIPGAEPMFDIYLHYIENAEVAHRLDTSAGFIVLDKDMRLQINEIGCISVNLTVLRGFKEAIESVLRIHDEDVSAGRA